MAKDGKSAVTPKLRFPKFRNASAWKSTSLSSIAGPVIERAEAGDGSLVLTLSGEHGIVLQSEYFGKQVAGTNSERYIKIIRDDFVYNDRTTKQSTYGTIKRLINQDGGIVSPIYKCFRFGIGENPTFWEFYFGSGIHDAELKELVNEGARAGRFNISIDKFLSTTGWRPGKNEQQKIADCLMSLDEVIAAQGRFVAALKTYKRGLMQQLFPREGETVPRLRFPEFRDAPEWKQVNAGILFANRSERGDDTLPIYSVTMTDGLVKRTSLDRRIDDLAEATGNKKAYRQDVAYNMMRMWQGACGVAFEECMVSPAYVVLSPQSGVHSPFYGYLFKLPQMLRGFTAHSRGLTEDRLRLYYQDFGSIPLPQPDVREQERIADCLSALDTRVAVEFERLESLKTHKKGLMRQLFPSLEEA